MMLILVDQSDYSKIDLQNAKVKLNPEFISAYNVDVQNDIIAQDEIKMDGITIDIDTLRYMKKIPIHYEKEICLSDGNGIECVNKDHIDVKG